MNFQRFTFPIMAFLFLMMFGCQDVLDNPKYQQPETLEGKIYAQLESHTDLSTLKELVDKTLYADVLSRSGLFTLFAPTNEAFETFFANNQWGYNSVDDMDEVIAENILRYLLIQDGWSSEQLRNVGANGFGEPTGFKRETLYPAVKYKDIVGNTEKWTISNSVRYVPLFYREYFDYYNYNTSAYSFFYPKQIWSNDALYYAGAKIIERDIPAENGFVHKINEVVTALPNLEEIVRDNDDYSTFYALCQKFASYNYNDAATQSQEGAGEGRIVDSLFSKNYSFNTNFVKEKITSGAGPNSHLTTNYTLLAPTNDVLDAYLNDIILSQYQSLDDLALFVLKPIICSHLRNTVTYPDNLQQGIITEGGERHIIDIQDDVDEKIYGSNGTFYGINKVLKTRALSSVYGPLMLNPDYYALAMAINYANVMPLIKRADRQFTIFALSNDAFYNDSSFYLTSQLGGELNFVDYSSEEGGFNSDKFSRISKDDIIEMALTHIAFGVPTGIANEEYMLNLSGSYLKILNNADSIESFGEGERYVHFKDYEGGVYDNGKLYDINKRLTSGTSSSIYSEINNNSQGKYTKFRQLLIAADLMDAVRNKFTFTYQNEILSIFIPNNEILENYTYANKEELATFLKSHFIRGEMIFTDGNRTGEFETFARDESGSVIRASVTAFPGGDSDILELSIGTQKVSVQEDLRNTICRDGVLHLIDGYLIR